MNKSFFALAIALSVLPVAAAAQDNQPQLTPDQRQALQQTFQRYGAQEEQLHQQMRYQMLSTLSPVHRRAVAATIGELAISPDPDLDGAAKRLDQMLSSYERTRILAAHQAFVDQSRQLHEQMRTEIQSELPADHPAWTGHGPPNGRMTPPNFDAGTLLLMELSPHPKMMGHFGPDMMHIEGAPPQ
jgi:hypothetical protein